MRAEFVKYVSVTGECANHVYGLFIWETLDSIVWKSTVPNMVTEIRTWEWRRAAHLSPFCYPDWADTRGVLLRENQWWRWRSDFQTFFFFLKRNLRTNGLKVQSWIPPQKYNVLNDCLIGFCGSLDCSAWTHSLIGDEPDWKPGDRLLKSWRWLPFYWHRSRFKLVLQQGFILEERVPKQDSKCQAKLLL